MITSWDMSIANAISERWLGVLAILSHVNNDLMLQFCLGSPRSYINADIGEIIAQSENKDIKFSACLRRLSWCMGSDDMKDECNKLPLEYSCCSPQILPFILEMAW